MYFLYYWRLSISYLPQTQMTLKTPEFAYSESPRSILTHCDGGVDNPGCLVLPVGSCPHRYFPHVGSKPSSQSMSKCSIPYVSRLDRLNLIQMSCSEWYGWISVNLPIEKQKGYILVPSLFRTSNRFFFCFFLFVCFIVCLWQVPHLSIPDFPPKTKN